jgi:hypoxia up-regulated 1
MVRRPSGARLWPSLVLLCSLVTSALAAGSVLAIDYGADSFKASLIKPGVPFDVLLNRDSKRKTSSSITLRGEDRHVGGDSVTLVR